MLNPETVHEVLGDHPDPHTVACIRFNIMAAVRALEAEIAAGAMAPGLRLVHGRPIADWLPLDFVAGLLRSWRDRP